MRRISRASRYSMSAKSTNGNYFSLSRRKLIGSNAVSRNSPAKSCSLTRPFVNTFSIRNVRSSLAAPGIISARNVTFIWGLAQIKATFASIFFSKAMNRFPDLSCVSPSAVQGEFSPQRRHRRISATAELSVFGSNRKPVAGPTLFSLDASRTTIIAKY